MAGVFARQVPTPDASAVTRDQLSRWVASHTTSRHETLDPETFARLAPADRLMRCAFDNVCSAVRRTVWEVSPFQATPIAEDLEWSRNVLLAGHAIAYALDAVVEHSHDRAARYELARTWVLHQQLHRLFGMRSVPTVGALAGSVRLDAAGASAAGRRRRRAHRLGRVAARHVAWGLPGRSDSFSAAGRRRGAAPHWRPRGV